MKQLFSNILLITLGIAIFVLLAPDILDRTSTFTHRIPAVQHAVTPSQEARPTRSSSTPSNPKLSSALTSPESTSPARRLVPAPLPKVTSLPPIQKTPVKSTKTVPSVKSLPKPETAVVEQIASTTPLPPASDVSASLSAIPSDSGELNEQGIFDIVNAERIHAGLPPLSYNKTLALIADVKAGDMITKQYFEHVAPDGTDVAKLAERYGYEYLRVGENLAMGDFTSNKEVMTGWMNSPGHRANILNKEYTEIGISAREGMHDGRMMWYAVQEFGRPASLCPKPDELLVKKITLYQGQLASLDKTMASLREEIASAEGNPELYNAKANDFNTIVELYNTVVAMTKEAIKTYNASVATYNLCIN